MRSAEEGDDSPLAAEWRRLRCAAAFFVACVAVVVIAGLVGVYH